VRIRADWLFRMSIPLGIRLRWDADVAVLVLDGELDLTAAAALLGMTDDLTRAGVRSIVYDLEGLQCVPDPRLLTVFATVQRRMGAWPQHSLYLAGATVGVGLRLRKLGIDRFVSMDSSVAGALLTAHAGENAAYRNVALLPDASSPGRARTCLAAMPGGGEEPWLDGAPVVISELTTNAVRHVHQPFTLNLALSPSQLLISVSDPSRREPILRPPRVDAMGGRGIHLVEAYSESWGVRWIYQGGKTVWARMAPVAA
jgi:hypothetical protein